MLKSVAAAGPDAASQNRINWVKSLPFFGLHLACFAAIFTGVSWGALWLCLSLYVIRMFAITAGYHRYFAHRTYRTSRWFQFILAWIGCSALQKGPLWWASHHRHHHQHSDQGEDVHSPERLGFWWSHLGWILCSRYQDTNLRRIQDFANYPELRWLNHFHVIPGLLLAVGCFLLAGWQGLVWGFFISTVLLYHSTFVINSLCHMFGRRRYETTDTSRNSLLLALLTMGEGWHNNHHHYSTSVNQGFFWWELDISYYLLRLLSLFRVVWDLKTAPRHILDAAGLEPCPRPPCSPGAVKKLNEAILAHYDSESTAENARGARVPPGGAGAWDRCPPAHALAGKSRSSIFHSSPDTGMNNSDRP